MSQFSSFEPSPPKRAGNTPLRRLIRSKATKEFLTQDGGWTPLVEKAARFTSHEQARNVANQLKLENVELYHLCSQYRTTEFDYTLSLN